MTESLYLAENVTNGKEQATVGNSAQTCTQLPCSLTSVNIFMMS